MWQQYDLYNKEKRVKKIKEGRLLKDSLLSEGTGVTFLSFRTLLSLHQVREEQTPSRFVTCHAITHCECYSAYALCIASVGL